jgi:hypothetical protein
VVRSTRTLTARISTPCQITHYQALCAALSWSGCASFANRLLTSPGRLFLGHSLPLLLLSAIPLPRLPSQPIRRGPAVVQAGFLWRHTFSRCKYPPVSHLISLHLRPCSALSNPQARRPRSALRQKASASLRCLCSFLLSSRSLIVILRVSFAFCHPASAPSSTGLSWSGL